MLNKYNLKIKKYINYNYKIITSNNHVKHYAIKLILYNIKNNNFNSNNKSYIITHKYLHYMIIIKNKYKSSTF